MDASRVAPSYAGSETEAADDWRAEADTPPSHGVTQTSRRNPTTAGSNHAAPRGRADGWNTFPSLAAGGIRRYPLYEGGGDYGQTRRGR